MSTNPYDLVFASDFSTEERAVIHEVSRKLNLKAKSYGKGEDRFITVSRKFDSGVISKTVRFTLGLVGKGLLKELSSCVGIFFSQRRVIILSKAQKRSPRIG